MSDDFDFVENIYSDWLAKKADIDGVYSLDPIQKNVLIAWWAKGEIDNGGFELLYSLPIDINEVVQSFTAVGAYSYATACDESKNLFPEASPPLDLSERTELVKSIMNSDSDDPWLSLNKIIWADSDKFDELVAEYIKNNIGSFT
jgi:hypothetical protein